MSTDPGRVLAMDLAAPASAADLGGRDGMVVLAAVERWDAEARLTLPDGQVVEGRWNLVVAYDGDGGTIEAVDLTAPPEPARSVWRPMIDAFHDRFGVDLEAVDAYLAEAERLIEQDEVVVGRCFASNRPVEGYRATLELRPGGGSGAPFDVVVEWSFAIGDGSRAS